MIKKDRLRILIAWIIILIVGVGLAVKFGIERAVAEQALAKYPDRGVPRILFELNGVSIDDVNAGTKDTKYEGNQLMILDGGEKREYIDVQLKGRGNTTWMQEKKPYQIKFKKGVDLFGLGKNKKWVFLANYFDASLMRNDVAMTLAEMLGMKYNTRGKFAEVYFNGLYEGVYYIVPKIEIAKGSVDLRESDGVLFEVDTLHKDVEECYESHLGECLILKDVVVDDEEMRQAVVADFMKRFNEFEIALEESNFEAISQMIDVESFVEYFLVNEFAVNPDAYSTSFYLYKNDEDKICAGPVWDFDLAFANHNWNWQIDNKIYSPEETMIRKREAFGQDGLEEDLIISKLFYYLEEIPEFHDASVNVFQERMSGKKMEFLNGIRKKFSEIEEIAKYDSERWEKEDFELEKKALMEWVSARYDYFERIYKNDETNNETNDEIINNILW